MKKLLSLVLVLAISISFVFANGQDEKTSKTAVEWVKSVEIQVPARAGGGTDVMARTLGNKVAQLAGNTITIVNNTDGGGVVAMEKVRTAKPTGSVILEFHSTMLIKSATGVYEHSAVDDFSIIGVSHMTELAGYVLVVSADSPYKSADDLINAAKAAPDTLLFGVETGGTAHIESGMFAKAAGIKVRFVEAGSDTEKLTALIGNNIDACFVNPNQAKQYIQAEKATALGVVSIDSTGGRSSVLPDVPSFQELGYDFSFGTYNLFLGPKGMDPELISLIRSYYVQASQDPSVNAILAPAGFEMVFYEPAEGLAAVKKQQSDLNEITSELGLVKK